LDHGSSEQRQGSGVAAGVAERVTLAELSDLGNVLSDLMVRLDTDDVPLPEAAEFWQQFDLIRRFGTAGTTMLARKVDQSGIWRRHGCKTVDDYLARCSGGTLGDARRQRRASEQLRNLPDTEDALRRGQLSGEQAEAISDAATANPAAEKDLLDRAKRTSLKDLRDDCGRARAAGDRDPDETQRRIRRERRFHIYGRPDGSAGIAGNGPVDETAVLNAALQPIVDRLYRTNRNTPDQAERHAYLWDALIQLARTTLNPDTDTDSGSDGREEVGDRDDGAGAPHAGDDDDGNGDDNRKRAKPAKKKRQKTRPDYLAILRIDLPALIRGWTEDDEVCEIPGIGPVPISRMRELLPESSIRLVITQGIDVANVTYLGRGPNAAQDIALLWSQPLCQNIACSNTWIQRDHRQPYAVVQNSRLGNFDGLCPHDHALKTYQGWSLVAGTGRRDFVPPDDPRHPNNTRTGQHGATGREPPDHHDPPPPPSAPRGRPGATDHDTTHAATSAGPDELFPDTG
jgi:hypothetical protein